MFCESTKYMFNIAIDMAEYEANVCNTFFGYREVFIYSIELAFLWTRQKDNYFID